MTSNQSEHIDLDPTSRETFLKDVIDGLSKSRPAIPSKYLYDDEGSRLFDAICELDAYYPTRTEMDILNEHLPQIADRVASRAVVIEPGAGSGDKALALIDALDDPAAIVPVDISADYVERSCAALADRFPGVEVRGVIADFTKPFDLPKLDTHARRRIVFFPGSTIGNFSGDDRRAILRSFARLAGRDGHVLLGLDLIKDRETLEAAYDDPERVTAAFNFNLLARINRELGGNFDTDRFEYHAEWRPDESRVTMHLESTADQTVTIDGRDFMFRKGDRIHTEWSHKFDTELFAIEAASCGLRVEDVWRDENNLFAVMLLGGL